MFCREGEEIKTVYAAPRLWVNDGNALLDAVRSGVGIGYLSLFAAREDVERGDLIRILPEYELPAYDPIYMLTVSKSHVSPRVEAFKRHLTEMATRLNS